MQADVHNLLMTSRLTVWKSQSIDNNGAEMIENRKRNKLEILTDFRTYLARNGTVGSVSKNTPVSSTVVLMPKF